MDGREQEFVERSATMSLADLAVHFGCSEITASRMRRKLGLKGARKHGSRDKLHLHQEAFLAIHNSEPDMTLGVRFGMSVAGIRSWRKRLGVKKDAKLLWVNNPHPRGATGTTVSTEARAASSARSKAMWADPASHMNSAEYRQMLSDRMTAQRGEKPAENPYSRAAGGKRPDLGGVYFRSSWEANYARYLNFLIQHGQVDRWEYEADTFIFEKIKRGTRSYKPDFKIWDIGSEIPYYVEIKGWMDAASKTRLARMARYYPHIRVDVVAKKEYQAIKRTAAGLIPHWENRK